jgi:hypothetical protein
MNKLFVLIIIFLIVIVIGFWGYRTYKNQIAETKLNEFHQTTEILNDFSSTLTYGSASDTSSQLEVVGSTVHYTISHHFTETKGICARCSMISFVVALPKYCCASFNTLTKYCPEQNKKFSEMLSDNIKNKIYADFLTIYWTPKIADCDLNDNTANYLRPIKNDGRAGIVTDFSIKWNPSEDEILSLGNKNVTTLTELKELDQTTDATFNFQTNSTIDYENILPHEHCMTFNVYLMNNQSVSVKVPNSIENYTTTCSIDNTDLKTDTELQLHISCTTYGYNTFTICYS